MSAGRAPNDLPTGRQALRGMTSLSCMLTPKKRFTNWREALKFINSCPVCGAHYAADSIAVFAEFDTVHAVHTTCSKCHSSFMAMIMAMGQGMSTVGMVTDLNLADAKRLFNQNALTLDDTIEAFEQMQSEQFLHKLLN